jgi:ATP/maltotriose-dependent transcriptional regulator MalT/DNA-binding SARP family transcriptional activator
MVRRPIGRYRPGSQANRGDVVVSLPPYHVARPRLSGDLARRPLSVVIAGAGFGKSLLAAEVCDEYGAPALTAVLETGAGSAGSVVARLRDDARQRGLSDVTAAMESADPQRRMAALIASFADQPVVIVIDEVQHLEPDAVALLSEVVADANAGLRMLLIGRAEPRGVAELRARHGATVVGTADLALTVEEVGQLCTEFGLALDAEATETVHRVSGGWAAAVVLIASRARVAGAATIDPTPGSGQHLLPTLIGDILAALPRHVQSAVIQIAHLPLLDDRLSAEATEIDDVLTIARRAGLPLVPGPGRWMQLIGPVQDDLRRRAPLRASFARRAAEGYLRRGLPEVAVEVLLASGAADRAGQLLAGLDQPQLEGIDLPRLIELVDALGEHVVAAHPRVLLQVARACEPTAATRRRSAALSSGLASARDVEDERLVREFQAEISRDVARANGHISAEELARQTLELTTPEEEITRARLLDALGQVAGWQRDDVHLELARERMTRAAQIYRAQGQTSWLAQIMMPLALYVHAARGDYTESLRCFDEALGLEPESRSLRGVILTFRADVLQDVGRFAEAATNATEALAIADACGDLRVRAYAHWNRARTAALTGDVAATVRELEAVEANKGDWFDQSGSFFLATAADYLDLVGLVEPARGYLARARAHPEPDLPPIMCAEAAMLARHGDPDHAERAISAMAAAAWFEPRQRWHATLLRAGAAARRGDPEAAGLVVEAFEQAARLGYPHLPLLRERALTERLLAMAGDHSGLATVSFDPAALPVVVSMLGGFRVTRGGRPVDLAGGQGRQLVKVVATAGGRLLADTAIELLWPDTDPLVGANRLRTVLNRLRESVGEVVMREDRMLCLGPNVETDAGRFEADARRALAIAPSDPAGAASVARSALVAYRGDLLPDDPYESWVIAPRERIRRRAVALLDLCADRAAAGNQLDEAIRCLERAIEILPDEEERYLAAARHLLRQGRRGAARATVRRAGELLEDLGLTPPPDMRELMRFLRV